MSAANRCVVSGFSKTAVLIQLGRYGFRYQERQR